ncbi:MAG: hypothetical protein F9K22_07135 [Bacteroidetes bacterium]|nr:MAG: hypothetical protein F9K22_07135 [Bacteroidota bacterium]
MTETTNIELRCNKTSDGKYSAVTVVNGKEMKEKEFAVNRSTEFAVVQLYQRVTERYAGVRPVIKGLDKHAMEAVQRSAAKK